MKLICSKCGLEFEGSIVRGGDEGYLKEKMEGWPEDA